MGLRCHNRLASPPGQPDGIHAAQPGRRTLRRKSQDTPGAGPRPRHDKGTAHDTIRPRRPPPQRRSRVAVHRGSRGGLRIDQQQQLRRKQGVHGRHGGGLGGLEHPTHHGGHDPYDPAQLAFGPRVLAR